MMGALAGAVAPVRGSLVHKGHAQHGDGELHADFRMAGKLFPVLAYYPDSAGVFEETAREHRPLLGSSSDSIQ